MSGPCGADRDPGIKTADFENNPVFLWSEIDKMAMDFRGDMFIGLIGSAGLRTENSTFSDHYVKKNAFDLSNVMFVTTANAVGDSPRPLLDQMNAIACTRYRNSDIGDCQAVLVPKQKRDHGLEESQLNVREYGCRKLVKNSRIRHHNLEQQMAAYAGKWLKKLLWNPIKWCTFQSNGWKIISVPAKLPLWPRRR